MRDAVSTARIHFKQVFEAFQSDRLIAWWLAFFIYSASAAFFVELVFLPHVFPRWHGGNGLLAGGDWLRFHALAVDMAAQIRAQGWSAWSLRPGGQAPAGIAAFFYALTVPEPWVMIPLNACVHAASAVLLIQIARVIYPRIRWSGFVAVPFVVFPSSLTWVASLHKDGIQFLGTFLFIFGWLLLLETPECKKWLESWNPGAIASVLAGAALVWVVRPYAVQMMQMAILPFVALILIRAAVLLARKRNARFALRIVTVCAAWGLLFALGHGGLSGDISDEGSGANSEERIVLPVQSHAWNTPTLAGIPLVPPFLDNRLRLLATVRDGFIQAHPEAASNIDLTVSFHSATDLLGYIPRALQIAFMSPFPSDWFGNGSLASNTVMRRISGLEMVALILSYLSALYAGSLLIRNPRAWLVLGFSTGMLLIYGLVICNMGTLYRMRYGFVMVWMAVGVSAVLARIQKPDSPTLGSPLA